MPSVFVGALAVACALVPSAAQALTVHVDAETLTASVAEGLAAERPSLEWVDRRDDAELRVRVRRISGELEVVAETAAGGRLLERRLVVEGEATPALRLIVLLVAEAAAGLEAVRAPRSWHLRAGLLGSASLWAAPGAAQLAGGARVAVLLGPLRLDMVVLAAPCCALDAPGIVSANPLAVGGAVEAGYRLAEAGAFAFAASGGVGVVWRRITGVALAYAGPAPEETQDAAELVLRATAVGAWHIDDRWALELRAGAELRATRLRVSLPAPYASPDDAIDPGLLAPLLELAVTVQIF